MTAALSLFVTPQCDTLAPGGPAIMRVLIRVAVADHQRRRPDLTAVLALDVSGSMQGEPLAQVIGSAQRICDLLGDDDALGIVTFESTAKTVAPLRKLDDFVRRELKCNLLQLFAQGGTNMSAGIGEAITALPPRRKHARHIVLMMSDGQPNEGVSTQAALEGLAAGASVHGAAISTLGFGANHDEDLMAAIAEHAGGRYVYIDDPKLADGGFARALGAQRDIVAEHASLHLSPGHGVEISRVLGGRRTTFTDRGLKLPLPDPIVGDEISVVIELAIDAPRECGPFEPLSVGLQATAIGQRKPFDLKIPCALTVSRVPAEPNEHVAAQAAIAISAEARRHGRALADRGNFAGAAAQLREAMSQLERTPGFVLDDGTELAEAHMQLSDDIAAYDRRPDPEAYRGYRKTMVAYSSTRCGMALQSPTSVRYAAQVRDAGGHGPMPCAWLVDLDTDASMSIEAHELHFGRGKHNHVTLADGSVSRHHATLFYDGAAFWIIDMGSTNTTCVNDAPVQRQRLADGDVITLGQKRLQLRLG